MSTATMESVAALMRDPARTFVLSTHTNADGDAIGSLLGLGRALQSIGRSVHYWHFDGQPVRNDLAFLQRPGERIGNGSAPSGAVFIALDCATAERLGDIEPASLGSPVVNIDHHHDNTRFGDINLVLPAASSTAEIVTELIQAAGIAIDKGMAEPLYVGIVTDTGRFGYANVRPETLRAASALVAAGVDVTDVTRRLYEEMPVGSARLLGYALANLRIIAGGRAAVSALDQAALTNAGSDSADGAVEALRGIEGVEVAAVLRSLTPDDRQWRISMRASHPDTDVSAIARLIGGGGHRAAAGCTADGDLPTVLAWLEQALTTALPAPR